MKNIIITLLGMCFFVTGCMNNEKTITLEQIKDLFEKHGVPLAKPRELNTENVFIMTLNDVSPEPFLINDDQLISIYIYSSSAGVKKAIRDFEDKTAAADVVPHSKYQVGNVLIIYSNEGFKDDRVEFVVKEMKSLVS